MADNQFVIDNRDGNGFPLPLLILDFKKNTQKCILEMFFYMNKKCADATHI